MTIREAVDSGVKCIRLPEWNASASLELPTIGPWVKLHDEIATPGCVHDLLITQLLSETEDRYVPAPPSAAREDPT